MQCILILHFPFLFFLQSFSTCTFEMGDKTGFSTDHFLKYTICYNGKYNPLCEILQVIMLARSRPWSELIRYKTYNNTII